jgi:hypothetical protein
MEANFRWDVLFLADIGHKLPPEVWSTYGFTTSYGCKSALSIAVGTRTKQKANIKVLIPGQLLQVRFSSVTILGAYVPPSIPLTDVIGKLPKTSDQYPLWIVGDFNTRLGHITGDTLYNKSRAKPLVKYMEETQLRVMPFGALGASTSTSKRSESSQVDILLTNGKAGRRTAQLELIHPTWLAQIGSDHIALSWTISSAACNGRNVSDTRKSIRVPDFRSLNLLYKHRCVDTEDDSCEVCLRKKRFEAVLHHTLDSLNREFWHNADILYIAINFAFRTATLNSVGATLSKLNTHINRKQRDFNRCSVGTMLNDIRKLLTREGDSLVEASIDDLVSQFFPNKGFGPVGEYQEASNLSDRALTLIPRPTDINEEKLKRVLKRLKGKVAVGQEGLPSVIFKLFPNLSAKLLGGLFHYCIESGSTPSAWHIGKTIPIYKHKGEKNKAENYRPITLIATTRKIFELYILEDWGEPILSPNQGGFRRGRGCIENLEMLHHFLREHQDDPPAIMLLDIKGAYDNINRDKLFSTLLASTGDGKTCEALRSMYISTQSEMVVNGAPSGWYSTYNGTQQGAPLSPVLFNYYIDPVVHALNAAVAEHTGEGVTLKIVGGVLILLFADDILIACPEWLKGPLLRTLEDYASRADITFAPRKCIYIGNDEIPPIIQGGSMTLKTKSNYLGATIDRNGITPDHFKCAVATTYEMISRVKRLLDLNPLSIGRRVIIFKSFIRAQLEYLLQLADILTISPASLSHVYRRALIDIVGLCEGFDFSMVHVLLRIEPPHIRLYSLMKKYTWKLESSCDIVHKALLEYRLTHPKTMTAMESKLDNAILSVLAEWQAIPSRNREAIVDPDDLLREASMRVSLESLSRKCPTTASLLVGDLDLIRSAIGMKTSRDVGRIMTLPAVEARKTLLESISIMGPSGTVPMCQYAPEGKRFPPNPTLK